METVEMLESKKGSEDGIRVNTYLKGEVYEMEEGLAKVFLGEKWAKKSSKRATKGETPTEEAPTE